MIESVYDCIRLVDPVEKKVLAVININGDFAQQSTDFCYSLWNKSEACQNCSSMRAFNNKKSIIKIESNSKSIFMEVAVPIDYSDGFKVIEFIKDITDESLIDFPGMDEDEIRRRVSNRNSSIVKDALTRIFNEQYIFERLPHEILKANQNNESLAMFLIKLQNKEFYEGKYEPDNLDKVLKDIVKVLKGFIRNENDWLSRYEKFGFIIVMKGLDENNANRIRVKILNKIDELKFKQNGFSHRVEAGVGKHILRNKTITPYEFIEFSNANLMLSGELDEDLQANVIKPSIIDKYSLSKREKEVALMLLNGDSNEKIFRELFLGLSTVKKHVSNILLKAGVKSRLEFVAKQSIQ